ncbi:MAG TPA: hypothetical protein V6D04_00830 [Candidatus Obscuribacterales bacterium]
MLRKLPWLSLSFLVAAYCTLGWFLYPPHNTGFDWLFAVAFSLIVAGLLTAPERSLRSRFFTWSVSSVGRFILVVFGAFLTAVVLYMVHVFIHILVTVAACMLARLDLQVAGFRQWPAFCLLSVFSLLGLGLGWTINHFV